ncbi:ParA family protein [Candidatus Saccharibacteria bacterium]|nr:ParA family protein [Candidatus Saccharibacteria bacterium]
MANVICITNQKGGVGKTTTAINLAYYLAKSKKRVLLIDLDPQGNATSGLGVNKADLQESMTEVMLGVVKLAKVIMKTNFKNLDLAPTTPQLANAEVEIAKMDKKFTYLRDGIREVSKNYDYVIIDSPPSLSFLTVNAMVSANYLLLPVQTEFYALEGVVQLLESMKLVKKAMNPHLKLIGVVATMYDKRTSLSAQVLDEIKKYFKDAVFETKIPRNVRVAEAPSHGVPVGAYDKFSRGAKAYKDLAKELEGRING